MPSLQAVGAVEHAEVARDRDDVAAAVDGGSGQRVRHGLHGRSRRSTRGTAVALRSRGTHDGSRGDEGGDAVAAADGSGFALGASRTAARSSGVAVRPRTAAPATATSSSTGTASTSRPSARRRRDGGLVGTGSTIIACRLYALPRPRMPLPSDAMTAIPELRNVRAAPVLAGDDARRCPTGAAGTSRTPPTSWSWAAASRGCPRPVARPSSGRASSCSRPSGSAGAPRPATAASATRGSSSRSTALRRLHGVERAETLYRETIEAFEHVERLCTTSIDADFERTGHLVLASAPSHAAALRRRRRRDARAWAWRRTSSPRVGPADRDRQRRVLRRARRRAERRAPPGQADAGPRRPRGGRRARRSTRRPRATRILRPGRRPVRRRDLARRAHRDAT